MDPLIRDRLLPGEKLVWSGQPRQGIMLVSRDLFLIPFSLVWCVFVVVWLYRALQFGAPAFFILIGSIFVLAGCYLLIGRFVADAFVRKHIRYAVTDRRVLILRPRNAVTFQIGQLESIQLNERLGAIQFGRPDFITEMNLAWLPAKSATTMFLGVQDARRVFDLIQHVRLSA